MKIISKINIIRSKKRKRKGKRKRKRFNKKIEGRESERKERMKGKKE